MTSIFRMLGLDLSAPDHTTLSRRGQHIDLPLPPQDRIGLERRGVNPNGVALDQIRSRQHLQDPREDGPDASPRRSAGASARSSNARAALSRGPAPGSRGAQVNRRCATRSHARNRCLRSSQSAAAGSTSPASDSGGRSSSRRTAHTALRRTRQTRACRAPDSVVDRTDARP